MLEVVRDNQLDVLGIKKQKTALDLHIDELLTQYRSITSGVNYGGVSAVPNLKLQMSEVIAGVLLSRIEEEAKESSENNKDVMDYKAASANSKADSYINKEIFLQGINWTRNQKKAAEYMLDKLR